MTNATRERIAAEARQAEQQMAELHAKMTGSADIPPAPAPGESPSEPSVEPTPQPVDNQFGHGTPVEPTPVPEDGSGVITAEQFAQLQHQLQTFQGRFEHTQQQLAEANARAATLERIIAIKGQAEDAPTPPPRPREKRSLADPKLVSEYGEELVGLMRSVAQEELEFTVMPVVEQLQTVASKVAQLTQGVEFTQGRVIKDAQNRFNEEMDRLVVDAKGNPDWQRINTMHNAPSFDRRFIDWLQKPGEDSYEPRQIALDRYYQEGNAKACARFFNKFKAEVGLPDGTATNIDSATQPPSVAAALVSPSPAAATTPSTTSTGRRGRTYNLSEIDNHYTSKSKGHWKGKEQEWARIAKDMDKAVEERRIIDDTKR